MRTRGEGVKKSEIFVDIINGSPNFLRWQNTSLQMTTNLHASTVDFLLGFARLCYHLVRSGNIKMKAVLNDGSGSDVSNTLTFPDFGGVSIDQVREKAVKDIFPLMTRSPAW